MKNIPTHNESMSRLFARAKAIGAEKDLKELVDKYDKLLKKCKNDKEFKHMRTTAIIAIHKLLGYRGSLVLDGIEVLPPLPGYDADGNLIDKNAGELIYGGGKHE